MSFLANKLKLEVKSGSRSRLARFASVQKDAIMHIVPNDEPRFAGVFASSSQPTPLVQMQSNIDAYFALISDNINTKVASFDSTSVNFGTDTLLRGNLVVLGTVYTVASDVLTEDNTFILNTYGASAQQGLHSVSTKALVHLDAVVLSTSNIIAEKTVRDFENLKVILDIDGVSSLLNNNFSLADFNQLFASKTLDDIGQGTSNRYIINNEYTPKNGAPFIVSGNLNASNIIATNVYANNDIYAKVYYGDGSAITNINSTFFNTNTIVETHNSSNLYFTASRAGRIVYGSNIEASNYVSSMHSYFMDLLKTEDADLSNFIGDNSNKVGINQVQQTIDFDSFLSRYTNGVVIQIDASAMEDLLYFEESSNNLSVYYETEVANASNYVMHTSNQVAVYLDTQSSYTNEYVLMSSNSLYIDLASVYQKNNGLCVDSSNYTEAVLSSSNIDISNLIVEVQDILLSYLQQSNLNTSQHIKYTNDTSYAYIEDAMQATEDYLQTTSNYVINTTISSFVGVNNVLQNTANTSVNYLNENINNLSNYILHNSNVLAYKIATEPPMNIITYPHLMHFKFQPSALLKDETNAYNLTNYGGEYADANGKDSILFAAGEYAKIANVNWSMYTDLTISGWFKSAGLADGDTLFDFSYLDIVSDQLKAWYNFESNLNDSTANNYTLISGIGADAPSFSSTLQVLGESSVEYTGVSQYLQSSDINLSNRSFSISFWLYLKDASSNSDWWIMSQGLPGLRQLFHIALVNETLKFGFWNDDLFTSVLDLNGLNNTWNHLVFVYDKENNRGMKIYRNNVLLASKSAGGDTQFNANTFRFGKGIATGSGFKGNLDDVKVYYKALSENEILRLYDLNSQRKNIKVLHSVVATEPKLSFVINEVPVYSVGYAPGVWNHLIWNVTSSSGGQGFIKINNGDKQYFNEVQLTSGSYINTIGNSSGVSADLYVSDFRVLTIPMTSAIETEIYSPAPTVDIINNYEDINNAVADTTRHIENTWAYLQDFSNVSFVGASNIISDNSNAINNTINVFMATQASDKQTLLSSLSSTLNNSVSALTTDDIPETASHIYYSDTRFFNSLNARTLDEIPRTLGGSNSVIVDNLYNSNLYVYGNLTAYNVELFGAGGGATFNTAIYNDERIEIVNYSNMDAVKLVHYVSTLADTMTLANSGGTIFRLRNDGKVGVKQSVSGSDTLDVNGSIRADYFSGSGEGLVNVNLSMKTTADLEETVGGSNLYFRNGRVSSILIGSNILTSNYVRNESNVVFQKMRGVDINISNLIENVSNILIRSTESIGSNYVAMTSNSLFGYIISESINQSNNVWNMSNIIFGNFSNLYIYSNQSNFMLDASNLIHSGINYSNYVMSNFVVYSSNMNDINRQGSLRNQSNLMSDTSNIIGTRVWTISRDHSNLIMGFSNLFAGSLAYGGFNNLSNYIETTSNLLSTTWNNMYAASSNYMNQETAKIFNYTTGVVNDLSASYKAGDSIPYSHTFDSNVVFINFRDKKILGGVSSDMWRITSNTCNYLSIYPVINNFTIFNDRPDYVAANEYAFRSTSNLYLYVNNQFDILKLMGSMDGKAFGIHFVFSTSRTQNTPIYYLGNNSKVYLSIKISYGYLYFIIGNGAGGSTLSFYTSTTVILPNTWYTVDFAFETRRASGGDNGNLKVQVLINLVPQIINYTTIAKAYDTRYYYQGAVYTNTYYSSNSWVSGGLCPIMQSCAYDYGSYSNLIFSSYFASNYDYQYSSNVSGANVLNAWFYDFADTNRLVIGDRSVANLNFVFTEVETNIKLQTGYYYFMLDLQNEITADLLIGTYTNNSIDEYLNVANYYNSNFLLGGIPSADINATSNQVMTYPVYIPIDGYYRFYLRMFRHINDRHKKYFLPKYYYTPVWTGSSYTFDSLKSSITYISYNILDSSVMNNKVDFNSLYYVNNTVIGATSNLYVYRYFQEKEISYAVGYNGSGRLGVNTATTQYNTLQIVQFDNIPQPVSGITQISAGDNHSLFLKGSDGTVYGCGDNSFGKAGIATGSISSIYLRPVLGVNGVGVLSGVIQVSAGYNHSLFLKGIDSTLTGTVYSCGVNNGAGLAFGQLGIGSTYADQGIYTVKQVLGVDGVGVLSGIKHVSAGFFHSLFTSNNGTYACGVNYEYEYVSGTYYGFGQLGIGTSTITKSSTPMQVKDTTGSANMTNITKVSAGFNHSLFLHSSGIVYACGRNTEGQLGTNQNIEQNYTLLQVKGENGVDFASNITDISANDSFSLFTSNYGTVYACGNNNSGRMGTGTSSLTLQLVKKIDNTPITEIKQSSAGRLHSLFLRRDGTVFACGSGSFGRLGINNTTDQQNLVQMQGVNGVGYVSRVTQVSAGSAHSLTLGTVLLTLTTNVSNYNYAISHSNIADGFFTPYQTSNSITDTSDAVQNQKYTSNFAYEYSSNATMYVGAYSNNDGSFFDYRTYTQGAVYTNTYYSSNPWTVLVPAPIVRSAATSYSSFSNLIFSSYYASNFDYQYSLGISSANVANNAFFDNADTRLTIGDRGISSLHFVLTEVEANVRLNAGYYYFMLDLQNEVTADLLIGKNTDKNLDEYANVANYYGDLLNNPSATISHPKNMTTVYPIHIPEGSYRFYLRMLRTIANRNNKYFLPKYYYTNTWNTLNYNLNSSNEMAYMPYNTLPSAYQTGSVNFNNLYSVNNTVTGATSNLYVYRYINKACLAYGANFTGQLGIGSTSSTPQTIPIVVRNTTGAAGTQILGITQVSAGDAFSLFLHESGIVYGCGNNGTGQLGINSTANTSILTQVKGVNGIDFISSIVHVSTGNGHSLFLDSSGYAYGCGTNTNGQLGIGSTVSPQTTLQQVKGLGGSGFISGLKQVVAGPSFSLFLKNIDGALMGTVYSCGYNTWGQLGIGSTSQSIVLVSVRDQTGNANTQLSGIKQISASSGGYHSLFLKTDGADTGIVYGCGYNEWGQLGIGSTSSTPQTIPIVVRNTTGAAGTQLSGIKQIAAGNNHSLFLKDIDGALSGTVYGCGYNAEGQLGTNSISTYNGTVLPIRNTTGTAGTQISGIDQISASDISMFLEPINQTYTGMLYVCGYNNNGQLGINSISYSTKLISVKNTDGVTNISKVKLISAGNGHSLIRYDVPSVVNVSNYTYNIPHSNVPNTFFAGITTSNNVRIQDFRIYPSPSTNDIIYTASNSLFFGSNLPSEYTITSNFIVKDVRWLESTNYASTTYSPFNRYITYNDTGDIGLGIGKSSAPTASIDIYTADPSSYSIKTNNPIWVQSGVVASSDRRIKTNIRDFNADTALNQILAIEPKTYNYVDKHRPSETVIGFSAQQIRQVIPNAVSLNTEAIPNIQSAAYLQDNCIYLLDNIDISDKIAPDTTIIFEYNNTRYYETVTEVINSSTFKIENVSKLPSTPIFVYGTIIKDFHSLDKNYIYTLSVCATQDIHKKQEDLNTSINTFIDGLDADTLNTLSSNIEKLRNLTMTPYITSNLDTLQEIKTKLDSISNIDLTISSSNTCLIDSIIEANSNLLSKNQEIITNNSMYLTSTNNLDTNIDKINGILQRNNLV